MRRLGTGSRREKGQSLVEFALTLPILLATLIGLALMAYLFYSYLTAQLAVRQGTNIATSDPMNNDTATIQALVCAQSINLACNTSNVIVSPDKQTLLKTDLTWTSGVKISVSMTYTVPLPKVTIPLLTGGSAVIFGPITIYAISTMTVE